MELNTILSCVLVGAITFFVFATWAVLRSATPPPPARVEMVLVTREVEEAVGQAATIPDVKDGMPTIANPHFALHQAMQHVTKRADEGHGSSPGPIVVVYGQTSHSSGMHARVLTPQERQAGGDITADTTYHPEVLRSHFDIYHVRQGRVVLAGDIAVEVGTVMASTEVEDRIKAYERHLAQLDVDAARAVHADDRGEERPPRTSAAFFEFGQK